MASEQLQHSLVQQSLCVSNNHMQCPFTAVNIQYQSIYWTAFFSSCAAVDLLAVDAVKCRTFTVVLSLQVLPTVYSSANPVTRDSFGTWVTTKPMSIRERSYQLAQKSISYLQLFTSLHHILRLMSWIIYITSPNHLHLHWEKWTEQNNNLSQLLHWGQDDTASHERQKCHYFVGPWLGMCLSALMPASAFTHLWFCAVCRKCAKAKCGISQALLSAHK